jgi:conjugal transfer pilus assembly protein TraA
MIPLNLRILDDVARTVHRLRSNTRLPGPAGGYVARVKSPLLALVVMCACALGAPSLSYAGNGGTEFTIAYTTITGWLQGDLGRLLAASLLVVGLVMGVVRQSIMAAVPAIACGLVATVAPTIIGAVVTAVI